MLPCSSIYVCMYGIRVRISFFLFFFFFFFLILRWGDGGWFSQYFLSLSIFYVHMHCVRIFLFLSLFFLRRVGHKKRKKNFFFLNFFCWLGSVNHGCCWWSSLSLHECMHVHTSVQYNHDRWCIRRAFYIFFHFDFYKFSFRRPSPPPPPLLPRNIGRLLAFPVRSGREPLRSYVLHASCICARDGMLP